MRIRQFAFMVPAMLAAGVLRANPVAVPNATVIVDLSGHTSTTDSPDVNGNTFGNYLLGGIFSASVEVFPGPPGLFMRGSASPGIDQSVGFVTGVRYYFEYAGPNNVFLPVNIHAVLNASYSGPDLPGGAADLNTGVTGGAHAGIGVFDPNNPFSETDLDANCLRPTGTSCVQQVDQIISLSVLSNTVYAVNVTVNGGGSEILDPGSIFGPPAAMNLLASADPYIFLDPSFANASNFQLILSDGIINGLGSPPPTTTGTPEPSMIGLAALAFGGMVLTRARSGLQRPPRM